jgi:hypothetical protein
MASIVVDDYLWRLLESTIQHFEHFAGTLGSGHDMKTKANSMLAPADHKAAGAAAISIEFFLVILVVLCRRLRLVVDLIPRYCSDLRSAIEHA